jgi:hypothetical protein
MVEVMKKRRRMRMMMGRTCKWYMIYTIMIKGWEMTKGTCRANLYKESKT